jgi:hypothetical protein
MEERCCSGHGQNALKSPHFNRRRRRDALSMFISEVSLLLNVIFATMNKAAIEQALTGLLPTLNGPLPSELVDVALSLLARSRSAANSLKPEEEIGRPYACAQLACER